MTVLNSDAFQYLQPLLIDEADTFLYDNDDLRGILNGNRKGSTVLRTVGDDHEPRAFSVYTAVAIALIGQLPDTLHDRAVPSICSDGEPASRSRRSVRTAPIISMSWRARWRGGPRTTPTVSRSATPKCV
jgi:hypothetical protein